MLKLSDRFRSIRGINILEILVILLIFFIPLYPKFPLFNVPGTYVAVRWEDFLVAIVVTIWFMFELKRGFPVLQDKVARLIILYWIIGGLAVLSALMITKNITPHLAFLHFIRRIEYMFAFFVAFSAIRDKDSIRKFVSSLFIVTTVVVIYGFGQIYLDWPVISTMNREFAKGLILKLESGARVNSTFAGHYDLAGYLVVVLALLTANIVNTKKKITKAVLILLGLSSLYLLMQTASRISFAAFIGAILFILISLRKFRWLILAGALSLGLLLFSSELRERYILTFDINNILPQGEVTTEDQPTTERAIKYSSGIRFYIEWPRALRAFAKNPFLGTGYSSVTLATDNDYLRSLAETGILGFISLGLIFLEILRRAFFYLSGKKEIASKPLVIGIIGATIGLLINALFIDVFEASKIAFIFWILMGSLVATLRLSNEDIKT